jgi:branched-chain amino acid transport system substrate-binding protein
VTFLEEVWLKLGDTNFAPHIPRLTAANPEIVVSNLWGDSLVAFIRQAKPSGLLEKASITSLFDLDMLRSIGPDMPEKLLGYSRCPFYGVHDRQMKEFVTRFQNRYQQMPADWAIMAYDGLTALTEAIKKAGSTDSDQVVKALEGLHFRSLRGWRFIRPEDHMANVGVYVGWTAKDPRFKDFLILKDITEVPADMVWLSPEEVKKLQAGSK